MDNLTKEQRHKNMTKIKSKNTSIEKNYARHYGKKDIDIERTIKFFQVNLI